MWRKETVDTARFMTNSVGRCVLTCFSQLIIYPSLYGRMEATGRIAMLLENEHMNIFIYRKRPNHFPCCAHTLSGQVIVTSRSWKISISMSTTRQNVRATSLRLSRLYCHGERNGRLSFNLKKHIFLICEYKATIYCYAACLLPYNNSNKQVTLINSYQLLSYNLDGTNYTNRF